MTRQNDLVLQALVITLIFMLLGLTACATALILQAYWDYFMQVLYFDSKFQSHMLAVVTGLVGIVCPYGLAQGNLLGLQQLGQKSYKLYQGLCFTILSCILLFVFFNEYCYSAFPPLEYVPAHVGHYHCQLSRVELTDPLSCGFYMLSQIFSA